ncbi:MAG TPA: hypothetical protein PK781_03330 [Terrimesophilobacter sp.]|nr:hypothetical protein [Terrimesophilobacter sp.]HRP99474.1 hypothetical protein [Terrimesophilobacter sp.]
MTAALAWAGNRALHGEPLSDRAHRLLIHMAHTAHDKGSDRVQAGRYFARWEASAFALGIFVPDVGDGDSKRVRANAYQRVKDVRKELTALGAIKPTESKPRPGRTAEYALNFEAVDNSEKGY